MNSEILAVVDFFERDKGIKREVLLEAINNAILQAARKAALQHPHANEAEFAMHFETKKSFPASSWTFPIALNDDQLRTALANGFVIQQKVNTDGQAGRLHIAVLDKSTGASGSVSIALAAATAERKP